MNVISKRRREHYICYIRFYQDKRTWTVLSKYTGTATCLLDKTAKINYSVYANIDIPVTTRS
jgi:hypothetical protein